MIYGRSKTAAIEQISYPDYEYYRTNNRVFTGIAAAPNSVSVSADYNFEGRSVTLVSRPLSGNYFEVLQIRPHLGRLFSPADENRTGIAVMTHACWKRLGSDPRIVGKTLAGYRIIGVTPREFTGGFYGLEGDLFTTLPSYDSSNWRTLREQRRLLLTARLKPGISRRQAQTELSALAGQLASAYPKEDQGHSAIVTRATILPPDAIPTVELLTAILLGLVTLVLLIACANVANLLLAVAVGRRQEAAIKLALGAPRGRLIREFLLESTILCSASGLIGYGIAAAILNRFSDFSLTLPMLGSISVGLRLHVDATVIGCGLLLVAVASLASGLTPALYASSPGLAQVITGETVASGRPRARRRNALVIIQVAICTLVLIGMGLCQRNLYNLRHVALGFSARNLVANTVYFQGEGYDEGRATRELYPKLRRSIAALADVESVALAWDLPLFGGAQVPVQLPGETQSRPISHTAVDPDYFTTFQMPIQQGRAFTSADSENSPPVAIVNQKMAEMFWPRQSPLGKVISAGDPARKVTIAGVVPNGKYDDLDEEPKPFFYVPLSQEHSRGGITVIARTKGDPRGAIQPFAGALRKLGLKILIQPVTLDSWMTLTLIGQRATAAGVGILSGLGLLLATIGLFGAISYSVGERKKELGIRVALGAVPAQLLSMILRQTLIVAGTGVVAGTVLGIVATSLVRSQLFGIAPVEWTVLVPVAAAMLVISLLIASLSARPWLRVDPLEAIRHA